MKINPYHTEIKILKAISLICLIITVTFSNAGADKSNLENWQQINTENATLCFQSLDDLQLFNTRINYDLNYNKNERTIDQRANSNLSDNISQKIDSLFERSQELLEMKGFTNKIIVKIFHDRQQLNHAFYELYKKECNVRAWYTHEKLTIYIQLDDLHEGMLAHEFAHAIINHYMIIPLPSKAAEILARYVDTHLKKDRLQDHIDTYVNGYSTKGSLKN
ncbi:hypothetical protein [Desulfobacula sp.]